MRVCVCVSLNKRIDFIRLAGSQKLDILATEK